MMRFKRNYEQKKALVNKWFTNEELKELQELSNKQVLAKVYSHSSDNLLTPVITCLQEIADEKENIMEAIMDSMPSIDNECLMILLDNMTKGLYADLTEDGPIEDIELCKERVREILDSVSTTVDVVKLLTTITSCIDRVKFFERRIGLAKAGVSE